MFIGNDPGIPIPKDIVKYQENAINIFPDSQKGINLFFDILERLYKGAKVLHDSGAFLKGTKDMLFVILSSRKLTINTKFIILKYFNKNLSFLFDQCNLYGKVRRFLYGHSGVFAENEESISVGVYASAMGYILEGLKYPEYGMKVIIDGLVRTIEQNEGIVLLNKKVEKIVTKNKKALKVICSDGNEFQSDYIISAASPRLTYQLISENNNQCFHYEPSNSLVSCFFVVSGYKDLEKMLGMNYWWQVYPEKVNYNDPDMTQRPTMMYLGAQKFIQDREVDKGEVFSLTVYTPGNFYQAKAWHEQGHHKHEELKKIICKQILCTIEDFLFPDLEMSVDEHLILTPWDLHQSLSAEKGNVYGRRLNPENVLRNVSMNYGLENLTVACATTSLPGVDTCFTSAAFLVNELTGSRIF